MICSPPLFAEFHREKIVEKRSTLDDIAGRFLFSTPGNICQIIRLKLRCDYGGEE
jgi:hypothetical protein